ncbi:MAG: type II secretion system F family protein [Candidatus ainarchaeum sp.]|nr:type II secretion system F family protein [Candidatus ainarchaeum sp.]
MQINFNFSKLKSDFEFILSKNSLDLSDYIKYSFTLFVFLFSVLLFFYIIGTISLLLLLCLIIFVALFSFLFFYLFFIYLEDYKQKKITLGLSDLLIQASLFPKGTDIIEIIKYFSDNSISNNVLSYEFKICHSQITKGTAVQDALDNIVKRNKNVKLRQIINYLKISYESGIEVSELFTKLSKNLIETEIVEKEKQVGLTIQKYTLLISSAVIVPLVLKWVLNIVSNFSFDTTIDVFSFDAVLLETAKLAIYVYIGVLSLITSVFVALIDGSWKKFIIYFIIICPLAYIIFLLV